MGINPSKGWEADYEILPGKSKIVKELQDAAKKVDIIYLAADPDREGEAIAWHLMEVLGKAKVPFKRVVYHEITKNAIQEAFANPGEINEYLVNAYKARRFLDRVVGFQISPLLWKYISRGLSAGRVQSVAVRLIVEREKEIMAFIPEEYWSIDCDLLQKISKGNSFSAELTKINNEKLDIKNSKEAKSIEEELSKHKFTVTERIDKPFRSKAYAPFVTSTLQQAASTRLGYGVKRTMVLAQKLYESGYITYMRTDSTRLSDVALTSIRDYISSEFGNKYLPEAPKVYASKIHAQEAHEAIRPSDILVSSSQIDLDDDCKKLYDIIWRQTVASQMNDAEFDTTTLTIMADKFELKAKGRVLKFDGWQKVFPEKNSKEGDLAALPPVEQGEELTLNSIKPAQHFTKPPPRYSEASLVKELEKQGIGRPSTYAQIISTIQERGYVYIKTKRFYAHKIGEIVTYQLKKSFPELMDYKFTANLEEDLDKIASADISWEKVLNNFYKDFNLKLQAVEKDKMLKIEPLEVDIKCEKCGRPMIMYVGSKGNFLGCSGYKLKKDQQCKNTINLTSFEEVKTKINGSANVDEEEASAIELLKKKRCTKCNMAMDSFLIDEHTRIDICGNSPICPGVEIEKGEFKINKNEPELSNVRCDKCDSLMLKKEGRFGAYYSCANTEKCKNTRKIMKNGEVAPPRVDPLKLDEVKCPKCGSGMILREGGRGLFLACSKFPRCRTCSNVSSFVLNTYKDRIDEKFKYLCDGPATCPECGGAVNLHASLKTKKHYFACENKKCKWSQSL